MPHSSTLARFGCNGEERTVLRPRKDKDGRLPWAACADASACRLLENMLGVACATVTGFLVVAAVAAAGGAGISFSTPPCLCGPVGGLKKAEKGVGFSLEERGSM